MEILENLRRIAEFLKEITPFFEALDVLAFIGIIATILAATRRKSYEIMIKHRLDSLDSIREDMSQLVYWFSIEGINDYKSKNDSISEYNADIRAVICSLRTHVKPLYKQEIEICEIIDTVWDCAKKYFLMPTAENEKNLSDGNKLIQDKFDLYDWTLWLYDQKLHKFLVNKTILFNHIYKKVKKKKAKAEKKIKKETQSEKHFL